MDKTPRTRFRFASILLLALAVLLSGLPEASARRGGGDDDGGGGGDEDALKLRVNDAIGKPGGIVVIVLRTYAARPIRQGQISVGVRKGGPVANAPNALGSGLTVEALTEPVRPLTFLSAVVHSTQRDSATQATPKAGADRQAVDLKFSSPSGTVNASDGPLAVLRFRLSPAVTPGQQYTIEVDPALTSLVDSGGQPIQFEPISAVLTVRAPSDPFAVEAEGAEVEPGEVAELGFQTLEPFQISSGRVTLRYNPAVAVGPPVARIDPRYGNATFTVTRLRRGLLRIDFRSPDKTLNTVPGNIIAIDLPTRATAVVGTESPVTLVPNGTWLNGAKGQRLRLKIENGSLAFED